MEYLWTSDGVVTEEERNQSEGIAETKKSVELGTPHSSIMALLSLLFVVFPFLSRSYSVNLDVHSVHSHAVAEA